MLRFSELGGCLSCSKGIVSGLLGIEPGGIPLREARDGWGFQLIPYRTSNLDARRVLRKNEGTMEVASCKASPGKAKDELLAEMSCWKRPAPTYRWTNITQTCRWINSSWCEVDLFHPQCDGVMSRDVLGWCPTPILGSSQPSGSLAA